MPGKLRQRLCGFGFALCPNTEEQIACVVLLLCIAHWIRLVPDSLKQPDCQMSQHGSFLIESGTLACRLAVFFIPPRAIGDQDRR